MKPTKEKKAYGKKLKVNPTSKKTSNDHNIDSLTKFTLDNITEAVRHLATNTEIDILLK